MLQKLLVPGWISPRGISSKELTHLGRRLRDREARFCRFGSKSSPNRSDLLGARHAGAALQLVLQADKLVLFVNGETTTQSLGAGGILGGGIV
jgi:hypothetical protein